MSWRSPTPEFIDVLDFLDHPALAGERSLAAQGRNATEIANLRTSGVI